MYTSLVELQQCFLKGQVDLSNPIVIENSEYVFSKCIMPNIDELLHAKQKILNVYSLKEDNNNLLVFAWAIKNNLQIVPTAAQIIQLSTIKEAENEKVLGETAEIEFVSLPHSNKLKAKVDTGAELSSLHVDKLEIVPDTDTVRFTSKELSNRLMVMHARDYKTIKSANGETKRPIVMMDIKVNGKLITGVLFNLADRAGMEFPVLLGKNALEKGNFLVNPAKEESLQVVDVDNHLQEQFVAVSAPELNINNLETIFSELNKSDATFADLMKYMRTHALNTIKDTEY